MTASIQPGKRAPDAMLFATTLVLCIAALVVFWPVWPALVLAVWTVAIARPFYGRVSRLVRGHRSVAAALSSTLLFVVLAGPLLLVAAGVWSGGRDLVTAVLDAPSAQSALAALSTGTPGGSLSEMLRLPKNVDDVVALAQQYGGQAYGLATTIAGAAWRAVVSLIVYFAGVFFLFIDGAAAWRWIEERSPLQTRALERLAAAFHEVGRGLLLGVGLTCAAQGVVATIVYLSLGVPRAWVLGPITGVAAIIPLVGTGFIWAPLAISFLVTGSPIKALVLAGLGIGVISVVDNFVRPMFSRLGALKMPVLLLFISLFGGLTTFGTWGAILGPLLVRLAMEALELRKEAVAETPG